MTLVMWKWCPLKGRELAQIREDQPITLKYDPWRTSVDHSNKEVNEAAFSGRYAMMLATIKEVE